MHPPLFFSATALLERQWRLIRGGVFAACVAASMGCGEKPPEPAVQLEAPIVFREGKAPSLEKEGDDSREVSFLSTYLRPVGVEHGQLRVVSQSTGGEASYLLQVRDRLPLPPERLDAVAQRLRDFNDQRAITGTLKVSRHKRFDKFLKTSQRDFPLSLDWRTAYVEPYVMMAALAIFEPAGMNVPRQVICNLTFRTGPGLPVLEGSDAQVTGSQDFFSRATVPHEVELAAPILQPLMENKAHVQYRDGRILFQFGTLASEGIEIGDRGPGMAPGPVDKGGSVASRCHKMLDELHPDISRRLSDRDLLEVVQSFGPSRITPLVAGVKKPD